MARTTPNSRPPIRAGGPGRPQEDHDDLFRLFRSGHILSSAVRDQLEDGILKDVFQGALTLPQFLLLKLMSMNGELRAHEVADFLGISRPAATKNIDKLVRAGLIVRRRSRGDRRATLVSVSPHGRRLVQRYESAKRKRMAVIVDRFNAAEIRRLTELMDRFSVALLRRERCTGNSCLRCGAYFEPDCPIGPTRGGCPHEHVWNDRPGTNLTGGTA